LRGVPVAAKSGAMHHTRVKQAADQKRLLELVSEGITAVEAIAIVGRKPEALKEWLSDAKFAAALEEAATIGSNSIVASLDSTSKYTIDFATFSEEFLNMKVFPHQQDWIDVLEGYEPSWLHESMVYELSDPNRLLVNVPPEHAKSTVLTVNYAVYRICMDPNVRIVIASQTQTRAKEFLYSIKQRLTEPQWAKLQQVYGPSEGYKATADQWTQDRIYLERSSGEKDPTVQALGIGQQIYGTRADLIILDDIVTTSNAHEWEKQMNWLQKMVVTRLGKNGKLIIAGTRVSSVDFYKELRNPDHWAQGRSPFTYLCMPAVLEFADEPEDWVTLWEASDRPWDGEDETLPDEDGLYPKWNGRQLYRRRGEVSASTWALVYQQQDVEEDAVFPPLVVNGCINRMRKPGPIRPGAPGHPSGGHWTVIMGLDPAMAGKTAAIMYAVDRDTGQRMILDCYNMGDPTPQKIRSLIEDWVDRYRPVEIRIEINAHQKHYALDTEFRQWLASRGVRFSEHFTGKNKWDTAFGVAAMSQLMGTLRDGKFQEDNILELPDNVNEHTKALVNQLITWKADTKGPTDLVMALWFCEIRAQEMVRAGTNVRHHMDNRHITRRQANNRMVVNLDDLAEQREVIFL
jgi:hypothetical protein